MRLFMQTRFNTAQNSKRRKKTNRLINSQLKGGFQFCLAKTVQPSFSEDNKITGNMWHTVIMITMLRLHNQLGIRLRAYDLTKRKSERLSCVAFLVYLQCEKLGLYENTGLPTLQCIKLKIAATMMWWRHWFLLRSLHLAAIWKKNVKNNSN